MSILCQDFENTPDEPAPATRVRCIVTQVARDQLVKMGVRVTDTRHLPRANNLWEVMVDSDWFDKIHATAQHWNCTFSDAIGRVLAQETPV